MEMRRWRRGGGSGEVGGFVAVVAIFGVMMSFRSWEGTLDISRETVVSMVL